VTARRAAFLLPSLFLLLTATTGAQQLGPSTGGLVALDQALRFLGRTERVLLVAAHPDDEDTELLTVLARGRGAEVAYLALTRGEGGQNLIGNELGTALGVVRSEELLAARALDGAGQFFTRAFDFGFSKSLDDTWRFWPRDSVLKDVVRIVRRFRPQVLVSVFAGTPRDGHGQHQAAGWAAREAFRVAGDPAVFPELEREEGLQAWRPLKLYQSARFDTTGSTATLDGGVLDPAIGQSFLQIAMRGRSQHRSQDMGSAQRLGPSTVRLRLVEDRTGQGNGALFAGIDTTLAGIPGAGADAERLGALGARLRALRAWQTAGLAALRSDFAALATSRPWGAEPAARDQLRRMDHALFLASGVLCDAVGDHEHVAPGETVMIQLSCWNTASDSQVVTASLSAPGMAPRAMALPMAPGQLAAGRASVTIPAAASPTRPYYTALDRDGASYRWPGPVRGEPFEPPAFEVTLSLANGGRVTREVVYRMVDQAVGEVRRPLMIVPRVDVSLDQTSGLWPVDRAARSVSVTLRHGARDTTAGRLELLVPAGWAAPAARPFTLTREGEERRFDLALRLPAGIREGHYFVHAVAVRADGVRDSVGVIRIEYPHVRARQLAVPAVAAFDVARLHLPMARRIGYVRGAADRVPEALQSMGLDVVLLTPDSLARGALTGFQALVIGPRAYETEPALLEHSARVTDFARRGGTVIVQYQQQPFFRGAFAPVPLALTERIGDEPAPRVGAPRVAEEDAAVTVLDPASPLFRTPNLIAPPDWAGWIQERGLYFARSWDPAWTPFLEMADRGEPPLRGGLLATRVGTGWYVYTGLSFFRQLPAGVPGAARLFLNLLALGQSPPP
jgi:LmbE family N-acetylglucosaminyl deacetylase